jgi:hypothetical protein
MNNFYTEPILCVTCVIIYSYVYLNFRLGLIFDMDMLWCNVAMFYQSLNKIFEFEKWNLIY